MTDLKIRISNIGPRNLNVFVFWLLTHMRTYLEELFLQCFGLCLDNFLRFLGAHSEQEVTTLDNNTHSHVVGQNDVHVHTPKTTIVLTLTSTDLA